ncbi:MAG: O-antigen ligase family protein, partial [Sphingomonadaceae bacterium]
WLAWWGGARARRGAAIAMVIGVLTLLPFAATERFNTLINFNEGTWAIRRALWQSTLNMLRDYPLTGVGLDNFLYLYREQYILLDTEAWREPNLNHPHQIVLHFWVALGIPGLIVFVWQQIAYWRTWFHAQRRLSVNSASRALLIGLGASMTATLAHGLIDNSFFLVDLAFIWMLNMAFVAELGKGS